ncbi:MAG: hypothetical protein U0Q18_25470 [Bryobacteraceae bacterium]
MRPFRLLSLLGGFLGMSPAALTGLTPGREVGPSEDPTLEPKSVPPVPGRRKVTTPAWVRQFRQDSRQQRRARILRGAWEAVNEAHSRTDKYGQTWWELSRHERRNLARAYAARRWSEIQAGY